MRHGTAKARTARRLSGPFGVVERTRASPRSAVEARGRSRPAPRGWAARPRLHGPFGPAPHDGGPKRTDPRDGGADRSPRGLGGRVRLPRAANGPPRPCFSARAVRNDRMSPDRVPGWFLAGYDRDRLRRRRSARRCRRRRVGSHESRERATSARGVRRQVRRPECRLAHDGPFEASRCARRPRVDPACSSGGRSAVGRRAGSIRGSSARNEWDRPPRPSCRASRRLRTERESIFDRVGASAGYERAFILRSAPGRRTVGREKDAGPTRSNGTRRGPTSRSPRRSTRFDGRRPRRA